MPEKQTSLIFLWIVAAILSVLYILFLLTRKNKKGIGENATRKLRFLNLGLLSLIGILWVLSYFDIYLRGFYTTKIVFWLFIFSAMILFAFGCRPIQRQIERIYYGIFFYMPLVCILISFIPFLGWILLLSMHGYTIGKDSRILYSDKDYRIQYPYTGPMGSAAAPDLCVKKGIFEYKQKLLDVGYLGACDSITINELADNNIKICFYHGGYFTDKKSPVEVTVDIGK